MGLYDTGDAMRAVPGGDPRAGELRRRLHADHFALVCRIDDLLTTDEDEVALREGMRRDIAALLNAHHTAEEDAVYSVLRTHAPFAARIDHAVREHHDIERGLSQVLEADVTDPRFAMWVRELQRAVVHHVHEEETHFLSAAEAQFGKEFLAKLVAPFEAKKKELERQRRRGWALRSPAAVGLDDVTNG